MQHEALSRAAADLVLDRMKKKNDLNLGLATGFSPRLTYSYLGEHLKLNPNLRSCLRIVQLDEWLGTLPEDPSSCQYYLKKHVTESWGLEEEQCFLLNGDSLLAPKEIQKLKQHLAGNPLDLCILGLGRNGHLALNEPGTNVSQSSRIVRLHAGSREHSMLSTSKEPITKGLTIGLKEIMNSNEVLLLIAGPGKEKAFDQLMTGSASDKIPASVLLKHPNWQCYTDNSILKA